VQVAVDAKHKLIVEQQVTNQVVDMGLLAQTAEPAKEVLGVERIAVVADRGYFRIEDIEACEKVGLDPYVPRPQRGPSVRAGLFGVTGRFVKNCTLSWSTRPCVSLAVRSPRRGQR
jgi:Transposase DDE domain